MKNLLMVLIVAALVSVAGQSLACHISFETDDLEQAKVGETVTVEAIVHLEHRRCELEDDDVDVELSDNAQIVSDTGWERVGRSDIHNTLTIEILAAGDTNLRVFRECTKKGISEGVLQFQAVQ